MRLKGYSPTQEEMAHSLGCRLMSAQQLIKQLEAKGYIVRDRGMARSIRLLTARHKAFMLRAQQAA